MLTGLKKRYWSVRKAISEQARYALFRATHKGVGRLCNICGWRGTAFVRADGHDDFVCHSHVLVYMRDDAKALSEIYRVLAPGGAAVLQVPLLSEKTRMVDKPTQEDFFHLWHPGTDYFDRYRNAGFSLELFYKKDYDESLYGLHYDLVVPICRKGAGAVV